VLRRLDLLDAKDLEAMFSVLEERVLQRLLRHGLDLATTAYSLKREISTRYVGQMHAVRVDVGSSTDPDVIYDLFEQLHLDLYGTQLGDPAEIVTLHATITLDVGEMPAIWSADAMSTDGVAVPHADRAQWVKLFGGQVSIYNARTLQQDATVVGPSLVVDVDTTIVVPANARLSVPSRRLFVLDLAAEEAGSGSD